MLSAVELAAMERGQMFKRYVRAAAALRGLFDDTALGAEVGRTRIAVGKWWTGSRPEPDAILRLADATGLSVDELTRYVYYDGPPPHLPADEEAEAQERAAAAERALRAAPAGEASEAPPAPHGTTGSGR